MIIPPQMQFSVLTLSRDGKFPSKTVGAPATHGAGVDGMQGIGVRTPAAAVVAAAVAGNVGAMQLPKGIMLVKGMWSMMLASGT